MLSIFGKTGNLYSGMENERIHTDFTSSPIFHPHFNANMYNEQHKIQQQHLQGKNTTISTTTTTKLIQNSTTNRYK